MAQYWKFLYVLKIYYILEQDKNKMFCNYILFKYKYILFVLIHKHTHTQTQNVYTKIVYLESREKTYIFEYIYIHKPKICINVLIYDISNTCVIIRL